MSYASDVAVIMHANHSFDNWKKVWYRRITIWDQQCIVFSLFISPHEILNIQSEPQQYTLIHSIILQIFRSVIECIFKHTRSSGKSEFPNSKIGCFGHFSGNSHNHLGPFHHSSWWTRFHEMHSRLDYLALKCSAIDYSLIFSVFLLLCFQHKLAIWMTGL